MGTKPFTNREGLLAWLSSQSPGDRVRLCRMLADNGTRGDLAELADDTVYELTRHAKAPAVAAELGLTLLQVQRAVRNHNGRQKSGSAPTAD